MRRTLLLSVLLSLALGAVGSAAPPQTDAASRKVIITLPSHVTRGKLTMARVNLPGLVAAVDGRVLVSTKAAEVVGVAVPRKAVSLMPVAMRGGYAYGAYGLRASHGRTIIDVVLLPRKSGRLSLKVTVDSMADAKGRRVSGSGTNGLSTARTLGVNDASRRAGTRHGSRVYATAIGSASFAIPAASTRVTPLRAARGLRSLYGTSHITKRDQDYARQAWTYARARNEICDATAATDPNGDGCSDIVDLQATLVATGRKAGLKAITPLPTPAQHSPRVGRDTPPTIDLPPVPSTTDTPETPIVPVVPDAPVATSDPAASAGPGPVAGIGGEGKGAVGKAARPGSARVAVTADAGRTFTVNSTADTADANRGDGVCADSQGRCTLRAAIGEADYVKGDDRIEFHIAAAAPVTIQLTSRLPYITSRGNTLTIDGYSQPGASVNTLDYGSNAVPGIELRGNGNSAREVGLVITSAGNTVRGLLLNNIWRGIMLDGVDAHDNRIVGNWIGFTKSGGNASSGNFAVVLNVGANHNIVGSPTLANRNVIGNYTHAVENFGAGTNGNVIQNNQLCIRPGGGIATCATAIDHNFGPKGDTEGGDGQYERNIIGPTTLQGIEFSHGWDKTLPWGTDTATTYQINDNTAVGNWVGFRMDGTYDPAYRSGLNFSSADNGQGINVYDGSNRNNILRNYVAATYDGIQVMAPNATGNVVRGNFIGIAPNGNGAAPLTGWGIKLRWATKYHTIAGNTIRNAALGGIGLVQNNVYNVRISRNIVTDTNGPAIYLAPTGGSSAGGANTLLRAPTITSATTTIVSGTGVAGAVVEVYQATRAAGQQGLPIAFLGDATVAHDGTWNLGISGLNVGDRVTALQIRSDDNTSALGSNVALTQAPQPPQPGDVVVADDFGRNLGGSWGDADQGGAWALTGTSADFSVSGSSGHISTAAGAAREARVSVLSTADVDVSGTITLDRVPTGSNAFAYVLARASGNDAYRASIRVATTGKVYVQLKKAVSSVESNVSSEVAVAGLTLAAGSPIGVRLRVAGTDLSLRVWDATGGEPSGWSVTGSDGTAGLQGAGSTGLRTYTGSGVTNGPVTVSLDSFRVRVP